MKMSPAEWKQLLTYLRSNQTTLTSLDLKRIEIGTAGAKDLCLALKENKTVIFLALGVNQIGDVGALALAGMLKDNCTLTYLNLEYNQIGNAGVLALAQVLKENHTLTSLDGEGNQIGAAGAQALGEMLKDNRTLISLNLRNNKIQDGAQALAGGLKDNCMLISLNLFNNKIGDAEALALSEMLKDNRTLTSLDLGYNEISDVGVLALSKVLKNNRTLISLDLRRNNIFNTGAQALVEMLIDNHTLTSLEMELNPIGGALEAQLEALLKSNESLREQLHEAVKTGDLSLAKSLLLQGVSLLSTTGEFENQGNTPLHWAVIKSQEKIARYLIQEMREKSLPLTAPNKIGKTAEQLAKGTHLASLFDEAASSIHLNTTLSTASNTKQFAKALHSFTARKETELSFMKEEVIQILETQAEWYKGKLNGKTGWVPGNHVKLLATHEIYDAPLGTSPGPQDTPRSTSAVVKSESTVPVVQGSLSIAASALRSQRVLGEGSFGKVNLGTWNELTEVAIKELKVSGLPEVIKKEFTHEAKVMAELRHPRIIQLYGVCFEAPLRLVMEYMPKGSLFDVLHSEADLTWPQRIRIALDTGEGLHFLHVKDPIILHRDLKSLNVLIDNEWRAKLTDFGLTQVKQVISSTSKPQANQSESVGTFAWMAPELFEPDPTYSPASDVYAYGVVLWELASRKIPFGTAANPSLIPMWVEKGTREKMPAETPIKYAELITKCWDGRREQRPTVNQVVTELKTLESTTSARASSNSSNSNNSSATSSTSSSPHYDSATSSTSNGPRYDAGLMSQQNSLRK